MAATWRKTAWAFENFPVFPHGLSVHLLPAGIKSRLSYNKIMIGLMSDSHDNLIAINKAISLFNQVDCSLVIHAGDIIAPFAARELRKLKCPVKAVFGNCEW